MNRVNYQANRAVHRLDFPDFLEGRASDWGKISNISRREIGKTSSK